MFVKPREARRARWPRRPAAPVRGPGHPPEGTEGVPAPAARARLSVGNTLIWGTPRVALRLEGNVSKTAALTIASSAR